MIARRIVTHPAAIPAPPRESALARWRAAHRRLPRALRERRRYAEGLERLRQPRPVQDEGLALVRALLTDGVSPLHCGPPDRLTEAAQEAVTALDRRRG